MLPYQALSPIQRANFSAANELLSGKQNSQVEISVVDSSGIERKVILTRNARLQSNRTPATIVDTKVIEPGIVYFNFRAFWPLDSIRKIFEQEFERLDWNQVNGLIIDVQQNPGGNYRVGDAILSHLIEKPFLTWSLYLKTGGAVASIPNPLLRWFAKGVLIIYDQDWYWSRNTVKPAKGKHYRGPVVVLISRHTGSAAEQFVAAPRSSQRALLIGETTCGGTGDGIYAILPGYGKLKVCMGLGAYADGEIWQGRGIPPDIEIRTNIASIRRGHDPVLAKAVEVLKQSKDIPR